MEINIENYLRRNLQEDSDLDLTDEIIEYLVELEKKHDTQEQMVKELSDLVCETEQRLKEAEGIVKYYSEPPFYSADAKKYLNKYKEE